MNYAKYYRVLLYIGFLYGYFAYSITVGSDIAVSRQNFVSFLSTDTDNAIEGFVLLDQGFGLEDNTTKVLYNGVFPIVQAIHLNGGTIALSRDLSLESMVTFTSLGTINGDNHLVKFSPALQSIGYLNTLPGYFNNLTLSFNSPLTIDAVLTFTGTSELDGHNNRLTLSHYGSIVAGSGAVLTIKNAVINQVSGKNILCSDDTSEIVLQNVEFIMDDLCTFSTGKLTFIDEVTFSGTGTFVYDSPQTSTILSASKLHITDSVTLNIGKHAMSGAQPFYFEDSTATLLLDNCYFYVRDTGAILTRGLLMLDRQTVLDMAATSSANGLIFGDGVDSNNDVTIYYSPSAVSYFDSGWLTYNNVYPDKFLSASYNAHIVREVGANMYVARDWNLVDITSKVTSYSVSPIEFGPSTALSFDNVNIEFPDSFFNLNGSLMSASAFLLTGGKTLSLSKGSFLAAIVVSNDHNYIVGNGKINGPLILSGPTAHVNWNAIGVIQSSPTLNGGTLSLSKNLELDPGIVINGPGIVGVGNNVINVDSNDMTTWNSPLVWSGTGGGVALESNLLLSGVWTCSGSLVVDGQGHTLDLQSTGAIVVDNGSKLRLVNMKLKNAVGDRIRCLGDDSTIELDDVDWILDDIFTFTKGSITYTGTVSYMGTGTFMYDSQCTSTITAASEIHFARGVTFNAGKSSITGNQPFYMQDSTAYMIMDNCYLYVRYPGYMVTRGTLFLNRDITIDIASTSTATGFILGDGVDSNNDVTIYYSPSAITTFNSGDLVYNNVNAYRFKSSSNTAKIVRNLGANTYIAQNWSLSHITSMLGSRSVSPLIIASGKTLFFDDVVIEFPDAIFDVTGSITNPLAFNLFGNGYISLDKGSFLAGVIVAGTNNIIVGNGKIAGPIILTGPTAQLTWGAIGSITVNPTLNYGTLILDKNLKLSPRVALNGPGTVNVGSNMMSIDMHNNSWMSPLTINSNQGGIRLKSNMILSNTWTCTGNVKIDGQYNSLDLGSLGNIIVAPGSTLNLKNITLKNIAGTNISCADGTASIIFQNVTMECVNNITFSQGSLFFYKKNKFKGPYTFTYNAIEPITLYTQSSWTLDRGFTFNYSPPNGFRNLLIFTDSTSQIILKNATFNAENYGIDLTKGSLIVEGISYMNSTINDGIAFGDETSGNDFSCLITNGSQLSFATGALWYKNINLASFVMQNNLSSLYFYADTALKVFQNIDLGPAKALFVDGSQLIIRAGMNLLGTIVPEGYLFRAIF